jgi:hypothetical protein
MNAFRVRRTGPVVGDRTPANGSVTRSPESQLFELRTGRGGPTPPLTGVRSPRHPSDSREAFMNAQG